MDNLVNLNFDILNAYVDPYLPEEPRRGLLATIVHALILALGAACVATAAIG